MSEQPETEQREPELEVPVATYSGRRHSWRITFALACSGLGVIYGDLGTSPLYVFNAIFPSAGPVPDKEDVIGALSAVIWSISIVPLIKYCFIALEFGSPDAGEGGPFAVYSTLYPPSDDETDKEGREMNRYTTTKSGIAHPSSDGKSFLDRPLIKKALWTWVLFGTCLTIADGLLTPAVSVTSAVVGISIASPRVLSSVVPISIVILIALFLFQNVGTRRVGMFFSPVLAVFLALIAVGGIINVVKFPGVFRAFDPSRAVMLFVRTRNYDLLAGVLLALTGVEAMFANLSSYSKASIRLGFACYVYPCLLLAYLGQGARLILDGPEVMSNVFFQSIPGPTGGPFWWITWVSAILAAVVASQAMITATFSLVQQLTGHRAIPALKIIHTDDSQQGQVFIPAVNLLLMIGTIALTAGFGTNVGLTNAFGFAVAGVMIVTTSILAIAMVRLKHLPVIVAVAFFILGGFIDGLFFGAALKKVPHGAWFPLGLAGILCLFFNFYAWARRLEDKFDESHRHRLLEVIGRHDYDAAKGEEGANPSPVPFRDFKEPLELMEGEVPLSRLPVFAFFYNVSGNHIHGAPHSFSAFLKAYPTLPQVSIFVDIQRVTTPYTSEEDRFDVSRVRSFDGIYLATIRLGYRDSVNLTAIAEPLQRRIIQLEAKSGVEERERQEVLTKVAVIKKAKEYSVTHVLPHFHVVADRTKGNKVTSYLRIFGLESLYRRIKVNFDEHDQYIFAEAENVLRIGVTASL